MSGIIGSGPLHYPMNASAVVLAGGRSSRFGRDKLVEPIGGTPVLSLTIAAALGVATDIVVVTGPGASVEVPSGVRIARDPTAYGGPLVGVLAGLETARHEAVLVVGGDMPWLLPDVLALMLEALGPGTGAVALQFGGRLQQLPIALRRDAGLQAARSLTDAGERRLGALLEALDIVGIPEATWRVVDPDGATVRDLDVPDDLSALADQQRQG